jgi:tartrate dehydrogenase/decarboxylase/D-malate dehydrogenase
MSQNSYKIAVIPGDGIGKETTPEGVRVLQAAQKRFDLGFDFEDHDFSSADYYVKTGEMLPPDWKDRLSGSDAIFFGAVGWPEIVPDHVSLWGSLIQFRREFDQYVSLRPARAMPGVPLPLAGRKPGDIDMMIVRENTEGEYSSIGDEPDRCGPYPTIRVRSRSRARWSSDLCDQVERHLDHHALLG